MNAENISQYLSNPSQLHQISFEELKTLVMQNPYSQSLHYLLAHKAKLDGRADAEQILSMASMYSIDRAALFQKMKNLEVNVPVEENYTMNEDYLELKDLSVIEESIIVEKKEEEDLLAFSLDDLAGENLSPKSDYVVPMNVKSDNLAEDELGESLLERILNKDTQPLSEVSTEDSPEDIIKHIMGEAKMEEEIIENSIVALQGQTEEEQHLSETSPLSPEEWLTTTVKEIAEEANAEEIDESEELPEVAPLIAKGDMEIEEEGTILPTTKEPTEKEATNEKPSLSLEVINDKNLDSLSEQSGFTAPQPKSAFNSWLKQYPYRNLGRKLEEKEEGLGKKKKKKKRKVQKIKEKEVIGVAKASVAQDEEIATETLAFLLGQQGHHKKAIQMYETLSLRMPEKSSFFAEKIENLKNREAKDV